MTYDLVALVDGRPSSDDLLAGLAAAGEELGVRAVSGGAVVQLCDDDDHPLVSIELPLLIQVPGEVERMLGEAVGSVDTPAWWVEIRATTQDGARELAERYAHTLIDRLGGKVWTSDGVETAQATAKSEGTD
ncbi:hypothetical protein EV646_102136 [Kribbella antiqua]|uniref:Uncharacterized protein n=1 Tax=Kribbella antiqua TaxID=2512217 RepID=A0A4R2J408_9ACTN|nr:hypothetical protein [Kribbella antiqua]TCO50065.1 hypothetical protein EV646_102136 [Kribbella antiqua]